MTCQATARTANRIMGTVARAHTLDKCFKLDKLTGINFTSSDTRLIKTALEIIKANDKLIENSKTGKVTAVLAIMKIFDKNFGNLRNFNSGNCHLSQIND